MPRAQDIGAAISKGIEELAQKRKQSKQSTEQAAMLPVHEDAEWFPLLEGDDFTNLVDDIRKYGLRDPIVVTGDGKILDGRNRYRACVAAGIEPTFKTFRGPGKAFPFVISVNLHRRHLDTSQRALIAAKLATLEQGARTDLAQNCATSQDEAAAQLNVSRRSVQSAKKVIDKGTPDLVAAVRDGVISVGAASAATELAPEAQQDVVRKVRRGVKATAALPKKAPTTKASKTPAAPDVTVTMKWPTDTPTKAEPPAFNSCAGPRLDVPAFLAKVQPIIDGLKAEGRKNMATMSPGTVAHLTFQLERYLDRLTRDTTSDPVKETGR